MPDHVDPRVKRERVQRARALENELVEIEGLRWVGERVAVLVESVREDGTPPSSVGRAEPDADCDRVRARGTSREGHRIDFVAPRHRVERRPEVQVEITGFKGRTHEGELFDPSAVAGVS